MSNKKSSYDFFKIQDYFINKWDSEKIFEIKKSDKKIFSIDTPPPTVSGALHIGHIFSYTHADFIARYKRLNNFEVFYPFGFDNNGLPTERYVEKETGKVSHSMPRNEFINLCLEFTEKVQYKFIDLWKKIGLSIDWRLCYSTISKEAQKISQKNFIELYKKGFIYKKSEPALFCTAFRTSVSQAELEEVEKETLFSELSFKIENSNEEIIIATTRPELLASCCAIFFNPEDNRYKNLENKKAVVPIYNFSVPILPDDKVIKDKGTGLVMFCTFGDSLDVQWFKKYNFPYLQSIGLDGKMTERTGFLKNLSVFQAREEILKRLSQEGIIKKQEKIKHFVSIYERSKKEIEYVVLSQWFVSLLNFKEEFLKIGEKINWYPTNMKERYKNWVENLKWDWCISRQRFYGIPFPVWYDKNENVILPDEKDLPVDPMTEFPKNFSGELFPDSDVMDTWNTSSLTPFLCKNLYEKFIEENSNEFFPMEIRPQAHDIIRTWTFDTIVKSWMSNRDESKKLPWKNIIISGHVLSKDKEKISKSKGNNPLDPENLIKNYPIDAIRYWTASAKLGIDTAFSEDQLKQGNRLLIKLFNAAKFVEQNCKEECIFLNEKFENFSEIKIDVNNWIINELSSCLKIYKESFEKYEFSSALESIEKFFWSIFCDNYLEIIKDMFFKPEKYNFEEINETKKTLSFIFRSILNLYSPFLIYLTEEIYQNLFAKNSNFKSIHNFSLTPLFEILEKESNKTNIKFNYFLEIISKVRKLKTNLNLSLKTEVEKITINLKENFLISENMKNLIMGTIYSKEILFLNNNFLVSEDVIKNENEKFYIEITI